MILVMILTLLIIITIIQIVVLVIVAVVVVIIIVMTIMMLILASPGWGAAHHFKIHLFEHHMKIVAFVLPPPFSTLPFRFRD